MNRALSRSAGFSIK